MYLCIDLKSFYASAECARLGVDPFKVNLVVANKSRGKGALCLAITPAMKALGVKNRCRLFEIPPSVDYITVKPHMRYYMEVSAAIYKVYLSYIAKEDIYPYSIDECFISIGPYKNQLCRRHRYEFVSGKNRAGHHRQTCARPHRIS